MLADVAGCRIERKGVLVPVLVVLGGLAVTASRGIDVVAGGAVRVLEPNAVGV